MNFGRILIAARDSLRWNFLSTLAGLFQIFIVFFYSLFIKNHANIKIIICGVILFFCSAIASSSVIDYWLTKEDFLNVKYKNHFKIIFFYAIPLSIIPFVSLMYSGLYLTTEENIIVSMVLKLTAIYFM